jgi:hypothetical protein
VTKKSLEWLNEEEIEIRDVSALTNRNVQKTFDEIVKEILRK